MFYDDIDRDFYLQLRGYHMTTAEILYRMPDHQHLLQIYVWQGFDLPPEFPRLTGFLDFWRRELEGPLFKVTVTSSGLIGPATIRQVNAELVLPRNTLH